MKESDEYNIFRILSAVFGILGLIIMLRVLITHPSEYAVGERFVIDELVIPTSVYTFHFKPITLFTIFGFMYWILGLEGYRNYIARIPRIIKRLIMMFMLLSAFIMMYEFIQTFLVWISFYITYGGDLDMLYHKINPVMPKPVNFNFVSKLYAMFFSGSLYGIYYFLKLDKNTSNIIKDKMLS